LFVSHLLLDTGYGRYQIGYNDGSAFTASRKTDVEAREKSEEVEAGWIGLWPLVCLFFFSSILMPLPSLRFFFFLTLIEPKEYGIKAPSTLSQMLPQFDIVYGHMIDFFHNLQIVRDSLPLLLPLYPLFLFH